MRSTSNGQRRLGRGDLGLSAGSAPRSSTNLGARSSAFFDGASAQEAPAKPQRTGRGNTIPPTVELFAWLEGVHAQVLPKSPMGEAIGYALNQKAALMRYTEQGFLEIDNNASERGEKTIAIGQRNWLFFGSEA